MTMKVLTATSIVIVRVNQRLE